MTKPLLSTVGLALATRGITNLDPSSLLGISLGENALKVRKAIDIDAPIDEVYRFWRNFQNFPQFFEHVKDISQRGDTTVWTIMGPAGSSVEFESYLTQDVPNERIEWETLPDSQIHHAGFVRFDENRDGSTHISIQLSYVPPAGVVGYAIAELFGVDPSQALDEDLTRLKTILETKRTPARQEKVLL